MKKILIFGATSYIGSEFIQNLLLDGNQVFIYKRATTPVWILRDNTSKVNCVMENDLFSLPTMDAVINFAYIKDAPSYFKCMKITENFFRMMVDFVNYNKPKLFIHTSTQAVFGYSFKEIPQPIKVRRFCGDSYCDSKILAENILIKRIDKNIPLAIVRLGNVMGGQAPIWTWNLVHRILNLSPVCISNGWGYSNVCYIDNIIDYYKFLIDNSNEIRDFGYFHHLAEFSEVTWDKWIIPIAAIFDVPIEIINPSYFELETKKISFKEYLLKAVKNQQVRNFLRKINYLFSRNETFHRMLEMLKTRIPYKASIHNYAKDNLNQEDLNFINIIKEKKMFKLHIIKGWNPKVDFKTALNNIISTIKSELMG